MESFCPCCRPALPRFGLPFATLHILLKAEFPPIILIIVFHELVGVDSGDTIHVPEGGNAAGSGGRPGSLYIKIKAIFFPNILTLTCATCWPMNLRF